jgi:hypothetical protein
MERGIGYIEELTSDTYDKPDIRKLVEHYIEHHQEQADWKLLTHLQRQAMVYANIIEQMKAGRSAPDIRRQFEEFELVPQGVLPNPHGLLDHAFRKTDKLRELMIDFVKHRGKEFLAKLSIDFGLTVGIGVELGFPPSISLIVEQAATLSVGAEPKRLT